MGYYSGSYSGTTLNDAFSAVGSNPVTIWDTTGLATSTTNRAGIVNGTPTVTQLSSMAPGVLGRNLTASTPPALTSGAIVFSGSVDDKFEQPTLNSDFDFFYVNATTSNIKHVVFMALRPSDNNGLDGLFGNSGLNAANTSYTLGLNTTSTNTEIFMWIVNSAGGGSNFVCAAGANCLVFGAWNIYAVRTDMALSAANQVKMWRGLTTFTPTATNHLSAATVQSSTKFQLGDAATFGGADVATDLKLFAAVNGSMTDTQIETTIKKLGQYYRIPV